MPVKLKPLDEQVIVITGASSGIGLATARRAADAGARVVLVARNEEALAKACEEITAEGGEAIWVAADVGVREEVRRVVETVSERFGGFDTWVNDAGVGVYARLEEITDEDHERLFQTNYWGVVYGSTEALKVLKARGGALINVGSIASQMPSPLLSAYTASKHAVKGFTDALRLELIKEKAPVSVTLIKPSGINSPFGAHARNYMDERSVVPPPVYSPEVVADAILHAAERPTRMITVGGGGRLMTMFDHMAPLLSDRLYAWSFPLLAKDETRPKRGGPDNLHQAASEARVHGDQRFVRKSSLYTAAQTHPRITAGVLALAGLGAAALAGRAVARRSGRLAA